MPFCAPSLSSRLTVCFNSFKITDYQITLCIWVTLSAIVVLKESPFTYICASIVNMYLWFCWVYSLCKHNIIQTNTVIHKSDINWINTKVWFLAWRKKFMSVSRGLIFKPLKKIYVNNWLLSVHWPYMKWFLEGRLRLIIQVIFHFK